MGPDDPGSKSHNIQNIGAESPGSPISYLEGTKMAEIEKYGSVKRFGARYGRRLKERFGKIEKEQRRKQKCPYCSALKVKRIAVGIWGCRGCGVKFAGKAYSVGKKITTKEEIIPQESNDKKQEIQESQKSEISEGLETKSQSKTPVVEESEKIIKEVA